MPIAVDESTISLCTEVKQIMTKVISTRVAQVSSVRTRRRCILLSPSMKAVTIAPALLTSAAVTWPRCCLMLSRFSLKRLENMARMPLEISRIMKPSRTIRDERIIANAGCSTLSRPNTVRKIATCAPSCLRMSPNPKTSFSKKKVKGTSSPRYHRIPTTASNTERRSTGWFRIV